MGKLWDILQHHIDSQRYGASERSVAGKLGVSPSTLGGWRDLKRLPTRENLQAIAELVGVRYSVVLDAALYDTGYHEAAQVVHLRRPSEVVQAELTAAELDLSQLPDVPGMGAKRKDLQARVDWLRAEISSSRRATGDSTSVVEL